MADEERATATGPQRAELRLLLKRVDAETWDEVVLEVNPDDPDLSAEDAVAGIELLTRLAKRHEDEKKAAHETWGCLIWILLAFFILLLLFNWPG